MEPRDNELGDLIDSLDAVQLVFEAVSHADGRLALIFERKKGWCATDLMMPLTIVDGRSDEVQGQLPERLAPRAPDGGDRTLGAD